MNRFLALLALGSLLALGTGCSSLATTSPRMTEVTHPRPVQPRPDKATVVFSRSSMFGFALLPVVLDAKGAFLTDVVASSFSTIELAPGEYTFVACHVHPSALRAKLTAGKVYRVDVSIDFGVNLLDPWGHPRMTPVKEGSADWDRALPARQFVAVPGEDPRFGTDGAAMVRRCIAQTDELLAQRVREHGAVLEERDGR